MIEDSLKKRYSFKLFNNIIGVVLSGISSAVVPRALGPVAYGDYSFLSAFFTQFVGFLDAGTSTCFYTKLSQRPRQTGLISFYGAYTVLAAALIVAAVGLAYAAKLQWWLWPNQSARYVWMSAAGAFLMWLSAIQNQVIDAHGLTVRGETSRTFQKVVALICILTMFWTTGFGLTKFFLYQYAMFFLLCALWERILRQDGYGFLSAGFTAKQEIRLYSRQFYDFTKPLFTYTIFAFLTSTLDRWLLQRFAGSVEQSYYGLSLQIGNVCFLFTAAMTPLLTREFSMAFSNKDYQKMRMLFQHYIPLMYSITATFAIFCVVQANQIVYFFGGEHFREASVATMIVAFCPIYQTYGQLSGSVLLATGQVRLYSNLGISAMLLGLPLTYLLVAPSEMGGLNIGATGLALKVIIVQFLGVNMQLWYNARLLQLSFWSFLSHQIVSLIVLGVMAILSAVIAEWLFVRTLYSFIFSGLLYLFMFVVIFVLFPPVFGCSQEFVRSQWSYIRELIRRSYSHFYS